MTYLYKAFISYSHVDDKWGKWLHEALETYKIPAKLVGIKGRDGLVPKRLYPIFRDREELPTATELSDVINKALEDSAYLIVICSPNSAQSRWVNEEILAFKRMGKADRILAIIIDGEPNANEKGTTDNTLECFPEALKYKINDEGELSNRRIEPIAADAREGRDGKQDAFLKLLSGLLGVNYSLIKDRDAARQAKTRKTNWTVAICMLFLLSSLGFYQWEKTRIKIAYYSSIGESWGIPFGINRLSIADYKARERSYKFETQKGKVIAYYYMNSAGVLKDNDDREGASQWLLSYLGNGDLKKIVLRDHNGQEIKTNEYSYYDDKKSAIVEFKKGQGGRALQIVGSSLLGENREESTKKTKISQHRLSFSEQGFTIKSEFRNNFGNAIKDEIGSYGQAYTYDKTGNKLTTYNLSQTHKILITKKGIKEIRDTYDGHHNHILRAYINEEGVPTNNNNGYAIFTRKYDNHNNYIEVAYFRVDGKAVLSKEGYARKTLAHDERGNFIEVAYFGVDGKAVLSKEGYARGTRVYDELGNITEIAFFGVDGQPVSHKDGYRRKTLAYDERGNLIEAAYFGVDGQPVFHKDGYVRMTRVYDERDNITEIAFFGVDDQLISHKDGYARKTLAHDERGNVIEAAYFGV